ncbi:thioredoxin family protein [Dellaglioa algida]|uniref:Thiol reductase thioredoxin n=1 Tax=Dellaglioa algida TaxID=105612 RepID=A0A5C6M926_9LACO|nr:thioredoxin family protein [Dellaglioa algida]MDK1716682.1 thioredoxin family protein [Dellaglioa algida]MDK1720129.1 thioredoxin family protein [Dellaglioa algida]MDK1721624.1 thioredoxin family protein [Dellaglioa algida]MDK1723518.1 thioredoxin family protein [Dellaglioa algida]MDK1725152.1 thioredoxin family protein [Dellaglioa algida]
MEKLEVLETDKLNELLANGKSLFYFTAGWCPDCNFIEPMMPEIEAEYTDFNFYKVDRDEQIELCQEWGIFGIPSFVAFENGNELDRYVSKDRKTKEQIEAFMNKLN